MDRNDTKVTLKYVLIDERFFNFFVYVCTLPIELKSVVVMVKVLIVIEDFL